MEIRLKGKTESLSEKSIEQLFLGKRREEIALRAEANRQKSLAIVRAKKQLQLAAILGETRLYLESD